MIDVLFLVPFCSYVFANVLTEGKMILNKPFNLADRYLPEWIAKPLITCFRCVAAQWVFWYYLLTRIQITTLDFRLYSWKEHIFAVLFAVFISCFYNKVYQWIKPA